MYLLTYLLSYLVPAGISPELLKYAEEPVSRALRELFQKVWTTGRVHIEWKEGVIVSLYKRTGARNQCSSYRPISLLSVPGKAFAHVLLSRLEPLLTKTLRSTPIRFHKGKINYGRNPSAASTGRTSPRFRKAAKCHVHRHQILLRLSG